jgi:hypothetical protein
MKTPVFERDEVVFNGIKFRRYPNSNSWADRNYYRPASNHICRGIGHLHREVWKATHGEIPDGYEIHHVDGNTLNNSIDNLECLTKAEHLALHAGLLPEWKRKWLTENLRLNVRPKASNWHQSDEGREWHSHLGYWSWVGREPITLVCELCTTPFETLDRKTDTRFCSNKCKARARRLRGVDNVVRECAYCTASFTVSRFAKTVTCNAKCAACYRELKKR